MIHLLSWRGRPKARQKTCEIIRAEARGSHPRHKRTWDTAEGLSITDPESKKKRNPSHTTTNIRTLGISSPQSQSPVLTTNYLGSPGQEMAEVAKR